MVTDPGPLARAVANALQDAQLLPRDDGAVQLARRYAQLMDEAEDLAAEAARTWAEMDPDDEGGRRRLARLEAQLAAHTVAADLGPKLLAALTSLGMTPAGRGANKNGGPGGQHRSPLDELRARRERRGS